MKLYSAAHKYLYAQTRRQDLTAICTFSKRNKNRQKKGKNSRKNPTVLVKKLQMTFVSPWVCV